MHFTNPLMHPVHRPTKKSIGKAAEFVMSTLRRKAAVLRARLLFLASLRRRMAMVAGISRHIHSLTPRHHQTSSAAAQCRGTGTGTGLAAPAEDDDDEHLVGLAELARLFEQVADEVGHGDGYPVDDERCAGGLDDDGGGDEDDDDEPSVIDVIRRRREGDGREFRIEDEIDEAADMYIKRVRRRIMNAQPELVVL